MRFRHAKQWVAVGLVVMGLGVACSDAGLFSIGGNGPGRADRVVFDGKVCVPPATGDAFPVKVLFAIQGGADVPAEVVTQVEDALSSGLFDVSSMSFSLVAFHTIATGIQGSFVPIAQLQQPLTRYASYQEQGPVSFRAPLELATTILSGDMLSSCPGAVARTRYVVVLVVARPDTTCNNLALNNLPTDPQLDPCQTLIDPSQVDQPACSACELSKATSELMALADKYGAGQIVVQPIYVNDNLAADGGTLDGGSPGQDPVVQEVAAIAKAGGSSPLQASSSRLANTLEGLNYASLQRLLIIKRIIAFNRNARALNGKLLPDSDGDGIPDENELALGTDPTNPDTDGDKLMDGVELKMGLNPLVADTITGCNPEADTDGDRLNDCEERVLGTEPCVGDTDGDGLPDLVEVLSGTNPLVPEDLQDSDGDGQSNMDEVLAHTDPLSQDNAFRVEYGYGYEIVPTDPTKDGRACVNVRISNMGLAPTLARSNKPFPDIPTGNNDLYIYVQSGRQNDPHGSGISGLKTRSVVLTPQRTREPAGVLPMSSEDFTLGL